MDPRRWAWKRGRAKDDGPLLTERDRAEIDTIRRQLDAEYGQLGIPGELEGQDHTPDERGRPEGARRRLVLLVLCIGGLAGALGTAVYLMRTPPPNVARSSPSTATPARPSTDGRDTRPLQASTDVADTAAAPADTLPNLPSRPEHVPPPLPSQPERRVDRSPPEHPALPPRESVPPRAVAPRSDRMTADSATPPRLTTPTTDAVTSVPSTRPVLPAVAPTVEATPPSGSTSPASAAPERLATVPVPMPPTSPTPPAGARTSARPGMTPYADPQGRFRIEYPTGWQVRPQAAAGSTAFYLDDPDEGIAVTVQTQGTVSGRVEGGALTPIVLRQLKQRYPDLTLVVTSSHLLAGGAQQSEFTAQWTNRWAQRMRATGRIVSVTRDGNTAYAYVAGQAQELVFPGVEPVLQRMLDSFSETPNG